MLRFPGFLHIPALYDPVIDLATIAKLQDCSITLEICQLFRVICPF